MHFTEKVKAVTVTSLVSILSGLVVIAGWFFSIPVFQTAIANQVSMKFNAALNFVLLGFALLLTQSLPKRFYNSAFVILSLTILIIGLVSLLQTVFHFNSGADELVIADKLSIKSKSLYPGRMSVNTAICFVLFGAALLGLSAKSRLIHMLSQYCLNIVTAVSGVALIGYLYGLPLFYSLYTIGSMAFHSAILFFALSITASLLQPEVGVTSLFTGNLVGNKMARRLFVLIMSVIVIFGIFREELLRRQLFSIQTGISLFIFCLLCAGLGLIWHTVNWLNKIDIRRHEAEKNVSVLNNDLEKIVKERSGKLILMFQKFRESEEKFRAAFESSAIGMALISLKGSLLKVNKRFCDMIGYKEHELLTMYFNDIAHEKNATAPGNLLNIALKNGKPYKAEKRYVCKNGAIVWVSVNIATVINKKGSPVYFVSQFENITTRKKAEENLKKAYEQIQQQVRKQSHLIRSPVANLKGLTSILLEEPANSEILRYIQAELERLDNVIIEMAEDAAAQGAVNIIVKKRAFRKVS
ncbi:PAS domain S-box protein [Mucilaginibacter sp.]|uniref:PAS domain S-box protein n=1 Tax=Mucilaginibacter sp. TaxID=1882438 RepID=UPI0025D5B636|nr:PAS domain S-box protein [Mucilaginibacter sp.]